MVPCVNSSRPRSWGRAGAGAGLVGPVQGDVGLVLTVIADPLGGDAIAGAQLRLVGRAARDGHRQDADVLLDGSEQPVARAAEADRGPSHAGYAWVSVALTDAHTCSPGI